MYHLFPFSPISKSFDISKAFVFFLPPFTGLFTRAFLPPLSFCLFFRPPARVVSLSGLGKHAHEFHGPFQLRCFLPPPPEWFLLTFFSLPPFSTPPLSYVQILREKMAALRGAPSNDPPFFRDAAFFLFGCFFSHARLPFRED